MTTADLVRTPVTEWLKENGAEDYAEAFYDEGFREIADITAEDIERIVQARGVRNRLTRLLEERNAAPRPVPDLPAGTPLDLSRPTLESPTGVRFQLPTDLSPGRTGGPVQNPMEVPIAEWMIIAKRTQMLFGFRMDRIPAPGWTLVAPSPVLDWKVPGTWSFVRPENRAEVSTSVHFTEEASTFVRAGFNQQTATAAWPFAAASFERQRNERRARSRQTRSLFMTGMWLFPRATVDLRQCTQVSPRFVDAAERAVETDDPAELRRLFDDFGHVVPNVVLLGGVLRFEHTRITSQSVEEVKVENALKAAVTAKVKGGTVSAAAVFQDAENQTVSEQSLKENMTFRVTGGDPRLFAEPAAWADTVMPANRWEVILYEGVRSTIDLLDKKLQEQIRKIAAREAWRFTTGLFRGAAQLANNARGNGRWVPHLAAGVGRDDSTSQLAVSSAMTWSADYNWGSSQLHLTLGRGDSYRARIVRGGRQRHVQGGMEEISRWGAETAHEVVLMQAAAWRPNGWHNTSEVSLFVEEFGPETTAGFLIQGGRVMISSADNSKAREPHDQWGERVGQGIHEQLIGAVRMWNPRLREWGMGEIFLHLSPYSRPG